MKLIGLTGSDEKCAREKISPSTLHKRLSLGWDPNVARTAPLRRLRMAAGGKKVCARCTKEKSTAEFRVDRARPDGLFSWCRACTNAYAQISYRKNPEPYRANARNYRRTHPEQKKAVDAAWRKANMPRVRQRSRAWKAANKQKVREGARRWALNNKAVVKLRSARRRALQKSLQIGVVTRDGIAGRFEVYGGMCAYCHRRTASHLDHVKPLRLGGPHILSNFRPACALCNWRKGAKPPLVWLASIRAAQHGVSP